MTRSVVGEIKTLIDVHKGNDQNQINFLTKSYKENFDFVINVNEDESLPKVEGERRFSPMDMSL